MRSFARLVLLIGALCAIAGLVAYRALGDRALPARDTTVIVPAGATAREIGTLLQSQGVVASALVFDVYTRIAGRSAALKAGEFVFPAHQTVPEIVRAVTGGGRQVAAWATIPEGYTNSEIARTLAGHGIGTSGVLAAYFAKTPFTIDGIKTPSLEGYLFPDTYLIGVTASPAAVAKLMTDKFSSELPPGAAKRARALGYTVPQIVTIASLVEREAKADDERPLMAGVYYNRLRLRMPLQVDATIEYTFAEHHDTITFADLKIDSPYNTYKYAGLPPTPIANPGRASLLAAFFPKKSDYLYYVYAGNGRSAFARTLQEHNANVAKYLR